MREAMSIQHLASTNCQFLHPILISKLDIKLSYWISELAPLGSLQDLLFTPQLTVGVNKILVPLTGQMKLSILHDVCNGLEYLHSQGIVHGKYIVYGICVVYSVVLWISVIYSMRLV